MSGNPPVYQGTRFTQPFTLVDSATGDPLDITDWEFKSQLRVAVEDQEAVLTLESSSGGFAVIDGPNGRMNMVIEEDQTAGLQVGRYVFDVIRTDAAQGPIWLFGGIITVKQPVTR